MSWPGAILTDSGGFQVFSLADLRKVTDQGVVFRSHLDGSEHFLSPEKSIEIQQALGSDIAMILDECIEYPADHERAAGGHAVKRTTEWARRCRDYAASNTPTPRQRRVRHCLPLFRAARTPICVVKSARQLGWTSISRDMRLVAWRLASLTRFPAEMVYASTEELPNDRPRYVMGVGLPEELTDFVRCLGVDMMDCVLPTRNARNGCLFTSAGRINIKNAIYADDPRPLDEHCTCMVCRTYSRAHLRHLFQANEILASILNSPSQHCIFS